IRVDRLHQVVLESVAQHPLPVLRLAVTRQRYQTDLGPQLSQSLSDFVAVHPWQTDIQQNNLRGNQANGGEGLLSIEGGGGLVAIQTQQGRQGFSGITVVIDHEDFLRANRSDCLRCLALEDFFVEQRQSHHEFASRSRPIAEGFDLASVQLYDTMDKRQPDAQAAFGSFQRLIRLGKQIKHSRQQLGRNANTVIAHAQLNRALQPLNVHVNVSALRGV